jgi:hypothetical protein
VNATGPEPKPERDPDLLAAVKAADLAGAARLLRGGADVNGADAAGYMPLHWAVVKGNAAMVDLLLGQPAIDVDRPDRDGCPALFTAVVLGYVDIVRALVGHPAIDVDARYGEMTALLAAVAVADRALAEILLAKADPTTDANCAGLTIADFLAGTGRLLPVQLSVLDHRHGIDRAALWQALEESGAIAADGAITEAFRQRRWSAALHLPPAFAGDAQPIHDLLDYCTRGDRRLARLIARRH